MTETNEKLPPGFEGLEPIQNAPVAPAHGIAGLALSMAMKYHDINMVKDGQLYQQYKLEGRNMRELHLDVVFETAIRIEMHLLGASDRIAKLVVDAIAYDPEVESHAEEGEADTSKVPNADGETGK